MQEIIDKAKETNESDMQKNQEFIRYDLAKNVDALFGEECNDYMRFFELKSESPEKITFYVRKKFFGEPFAPKTIAEHVKGFCDKNMSYSESFSFSSSTPSNIGS